jgi:hypothetical protein
MILEELNLWFVGLGVVFGISISLIILLLVYKYRKFMKDKFEVNKKEDKSNFEEFNGIFLPLTEIYHYRYYYRY